MPTVAPYGSWRSPITSAALVEQVVGLAWPRVDGDAVYWLESRPSESGRQVVVRRDPDGSTLDAIPAGCSSRSLVHEYGGVPYAAHGGVLYFVDAADQRLYRIGGGPGARPGSGASPGPGPGSEPGAHPEAITPEPEQPRVDRYAAPVVQPDGRALFCVRERHRADGVVNDVVRVATDGSGVTSVASGHDFFSFPTVSPDGQRLAWTCWDHPRMPWDGTALYEATLAPDGAVGSPRLVAGGPEESVVQPRYSPAGRLHFVSDRSGWWNLYEDDGHTGRPLSPLQAEIAGPDWVIGNSSYCFLDDGTLIARWSEGGFAHLGTLRPERPDGPTSEASATSAAEPGHFTEFHLPYTVMEDLCPIPGRSEILAIAGSGTEPSALVRIDTRTGDCAVVAKSREVTVDRRYLSAPEAIEFPTEHGPTAHAFFYPPSNPEFKAPPGELPPLIVQSHGGPTSHAVPVLNFRTQFWTSRGFGVVDVDYGGSTGYGRVYRERLRGQWGIVDVEDCVRAALYLAGEGRADLDRLLIHGGSAGGYTTLCAVTFREEFAAGASYYGVADAAALARDTHKFEARYLDSLIGPWPEAADVYRERSPICHVHRLRTPLILFQGLEDPVVPPNQTETMADALDHNGVPYAAIYYPGEQHGFRDAANIRRTAEAELAFYGMVLGFTPADDIDPVEVQHADRLSRRAT